MEDYEYAALDLVEQTNEVLNNAIEQCSLNGLHITVKRSNGCLSLEEILDTVFLDHKLFKHIYHLLKEYNLERLSDSKEQCTLGKYIQYCRSIRNAKKVTKNLLKDIEVSGVDTYIKSYFEQLIFCLEKSLFLSRRSRPVKRTFNQHFQEYCALCWRMVDKHRLLEFSDSENYSLHYCHEHHPSNNTNSYHRIRNKLFRAVQQRNISYEVSLLEGIKSGELSRDSSARHTYKLLSTFSNRPNINLIDSKLREKKSWEEFTSSFLEEVYPYFPAVEKKLFSISPYNFKSWKNWFLTCIAQLGSKSDLDAWVESKDFQDLDYYEPQICSSQEWHMIFGWKATLTIFARYQAHQNVANISLKKGRKKGPSKEGKILRDQIRSLALEQINRRGRTNAAEIGRQLGKSRERVSVLLKELGLK